MREIVCTQGSDEWHAARVGKVTASRVADVTANGKGGAASATRARYMGEIVSERLTGKRDEGGYKSKAMEDGNAREADAANHYSLLTNTPLVVVGLILHPTIDLAAASPDRLAGDTGIVQIKCPEKHTHLDNLRGAPVGGSYIKQVQWEMACTGRMWCDFISYNPEFPLEMRMCVTRIPRDPLMIVDLERGVRAFLAEVDATLAELRAKFRASEAA